MSKRLKFRVTEEFVDTIYAKKFRIQFEQKIDEISFELWEERRETGAAVEWHFEDDDGNIVDTKQDDRFVAKQEYTYIIPLNVKFIRLVFFTLLLQKKTKLLK